MAILKHIASKNADYGETQRYLMFQYNEYTNRPMLNENGELIPRTEYIMQGINCNPFTFDMECMELNARYHKNQAYDEIKSHHYIISFDPKDVTENGLTAERAQQLGMEYAEKNFPGHQALVCTHTDGHNKSGNIHVHIVINSLRKYDVERQDFMERPCDSRAGYKHHVSRDFLIHLKQSVMDMCRREHLHQVDLLAPAKKKITEWEYHAGRRGQKKLDDRCQQMKADGVTPRKTKFQAQKDFLRATIEVASATACSQEDFQKLLMEKYHITLKISRGRYSYLHPERNKPITERQLGTLYEEKYLLQLFEENAKAHDREQNNTDPERIHIQTETSAGSASGTADTEQIPVLFIRSDLHLVTDLQNCIKAEQSHAYAQKVKLSNLKEMAKTVAYIQEHGFDTKESLESALSDTKSHTASSRKTLKSIEGQLRSINEQIYYTGQYLANKSVYQQFCSERNKGQFRKEHSAEISLYETARKFLKEHSDNGKLPSMKLLKEEKERLMNQKKEVQNAYRHYYDCQKELDTVCSNVGMILGQAHSRQPEKHKSTDIS